MSASAWSSQEPTPAWRLSVLALLVVPFAVAVAVDLNQAAIPARVIWPGLGLLALASLIVLKPVRVSSSLSRGGLALTLAAAVAVSAWFYSAEGFKWLGVWALNKGRYSTAVTNFDRALYGGRLPPGTAGQVWFHRAEARYNFAYEYDFSDEALVTALIDAEAALSIEPESIQRVFLVGYIYRGLGAYPESLEAIERSLPLDQPNPHWSLIRMAHTHRAAGNYTAAMRYLDEALEASGDEGTMPIHYHRGRVHFLAGRYEEAIESFTAGIPLEPEYAWAQFYRGCAHAMLLQFDEAEFDMAQALEILDENSSKWPSTPASQEIRKQAGLELDQVRSLAISSETVPDFAYCLNFRDQGDVHRERSQLLTSR